MTLQEELNETRKMLRLACRRWGQVMPPELAQWWADEQLSMQIEKAAADARRRTEIEEVTRKIEALQERKAALEAAS